MFASKTVINLDMTSDLVDHVDKDIMKYADNFISTPGTISTPHSPQFVQSDQLSSGCSSLDGAVTSSTPEKAAPECEASTPIIKIPSGCQGNRTYHTIQPCYTSSPKPINLSPGSGNSLHPLSPPLTPVLAAKLSAPNFVRPPPPPQPPSMLYSLYGMGQISEDNNTAADKPSRSSWGENTSSPAVTHVPLGSLYALPPRILYPGYQFQWSTELPSLTPYPLSTPALQQPDIYLQPPAPLSPSTAQGSPVQGHDMYFSQPSSYFNNGNF
ncbi:uncharacterized protein LOC134812787 [Bolinopsis microptera]|uniref:uncharacterized protein LOC134812787 n=1 Tax=Bolinopsis microptera TaxID=2820187 RepID=UPI0030793622